MDFHTSELKKKLRTLYEISSSDFFLLLVSLYKCGEGMGCTIGRLFDYSQMGYLLRETHYSIFNTKPNLLFASSCIFPLCRISQDLSLSLTTLHTSTIEKSVYSYRPKFKILFS